ncbi:MAG TPA: hypothetical protein DC054_02055 [Blastocatellia bacterium]|nr:hypothetical protein [Blastocatellia bacterium]
MSFDNVSYFGDQYRGDLIITHGVIYYFPHTNMALQKKETGYGRPTGLGLIGVLLDLISPFLRELVATTNQPDLRDVGLWRNGDSSQSLQARLDVHIAEVKKQPTDVLQYEYRVPKPMRFALAEIKNLSTRGGLRFDAAYDTHDFSIGFRRKRLLRDALSEGGFRH